MSTNFPEFSKVTVDYEDATKIIVSSRQSPIDTGGFNHLWPTLYRTVKAKAERALADRKALNLDKRHDESKDRAVEIMVNYNHIIDLIVIDSIPDIIRSPDDDAESSATHHEFWAGIYSSKSKRLVLRHLGITITVDAGAIEVESESRYQRYIPAFECVGQDCVLPSWALAVERKFVTHTLHHLPQLPGSAYQPLIDLCALDNGVRHSRETFVHDAARLAAGKVGGQILRQYQEAFTVAEGWTDPVAAARAFRKLRAAMTCVPFNFVNAEEKAVGFDHHTRDLRNVQLARTVTDAILTLTLQHVTRANLQAYLTALLKQNPSKNVVATILTGGGQTKAIELYLSCLTQTE